MLPIAEFAYNNFVNRTLGMSPFEVVHGYKLRTPVDLIPMAATHRPSKSTNAFARHIHELHVVIKHRITLNNEKYKQSADSHRSFKEF